MTSRAINWYIYESNRGGGGVFPDGFLVFSGGFSSFFLGHFHGIFKDLSESSAQAQPIATHFEQIGFRGVCGHVQKSEAYALGCRPRGESSHWGSN